MSPVTLAPAADAPPRTRLLTFTTTFGIGGTERHVMNLVTGLDPCRFELEVACLKRRGEFLAQIETCGVPISEYPVTTLHAPHTLAQQLRFAAFLRRRRIQIVHSYNFYSNVFAIPAAALARTPVIVASIRDTGPYLSPCQRQAQRMVCRLAHHVLVNADAVKRWLVDDGYTPARISVIRNGLDPSRFVIDRAGPSLRQELGLPERCRLVAIISRLDSVKGIEDFVDAAAQIAARFEDACFLVVGDNTTDGGAYRRGLEARAARLGLARRMIFTGFRLDVPRLLSETAVSVLPSLSEGLSNTVLESMAAGTPVVATRVGGNPEIIEDNVTGLLVPPRNSAALSQAVSWLLEHPNHAHRVGSCARQRVAERFSLDRMVRDTERLYERLLEEVPRHKHLPVTPSASNDERRQPRVSPRTDADRWIA